jgi:NAD(P)-dependent dehydrogenase (short-subunit alcohol dehydrogenase family)
MSGDRDRRTVMISGANRGIGAAIAERLAGDGWRLSLGIRDPTQVPASLRAQGALICPFDARSKTAEATWVEATAGEFGRIDAVVNNAGIMIAKSVVDAADQDIDDLFEVNVKSPLRLVRAAWPHLREHGRGRVVTIVSLSGKRVKSARAGAYSVSKFAALGLAHAIRHAGWGAGIRSTAICPGFVATDMVQGLTDADPAALTQTGDVARLVSLILDLPNSASVAELPINWQLEESF